MTMYPDVSAPRQPRQKTLRGCLRRFSFTLLLLSLSAMVIGFIIIRQRWLLSTMPPQPAAPVSGFELSPQPSSPSLPARASGATLNPDLARRIDTYISHLTPSQKIGQLLMLSIYSNGYSAALDRPLRQWGIANAIIFNQHSGGALMPSTASAWKQLTKDLQSHATQPMIIATDEEGGTVDRLAPYFGRTPSPQVLAATGDPQRVYAQAHLDAQRLRDLGVNTDFAPLADVYQGGAVDQSRMFGTTPDQVTTYAGAFLDGLQKNGVVGTLKHWPGLGSAPANPDYGLPTIIHSQAKLNAIDFASFRALLVHQPGMIMTTHAIVPSYDPHEPTTLSPILIEQVLRSQLGYQGVVVTDAMDAQGLLQFMRQQGYADPAQGVAEATVRAILAGNDIVECPLDPDRLAAVVAAMNTAVHSGRISQARLHQSLQRIIALKVKMGLISLP